MRYFFIPLYTIVILFSAVIIASDVTYAQTSLNATRAPMTSAYDIHPTVVDFTVYPDGSAAGLLANGERFRQYNIPNDFGIRIQRFELPYYSHYIIEGEVVYTHRELSIRLARI